MHLRQVLHFRNCSDTESGAVRAAVEFGRASVLNDAKPTHSPVKDGNTPSGGGPSWFVIVIAVVLGCLLVGCIARFVWMSRTSHGGVVPASGGYTSLSTPTHAHPDTFFEQTPAVITIDTAPVPATVTHDVAKPPPLSARRSEATPVPHQTQTAATATPKAATQSPPPATKATLLPEATAVHVAEPTAMPTPGVLSAAASAADSASQRGVSNTSLAVGGVVVAGAVVAATAAWWMSQSSSAKPAAPAAAPRTVAAPPMPVIAEMPAAEPSDSAAAALRTSHDTADTAHAAAKHRRIPTTYEGIRPKQGDLNLDNDAEVAHAGRAAADGVVAARRDLVLPTVHVTPSTSSPAK